MTDKAQTIEEIRRKIAEVDSRIVKDVAERMRLSAEIGRAKAERGMEIEVREIEERVLARAKAKAVELGVSGELANKLFRLLVEYSKQEQRGGQGNVKDRNLGS